MERIRSSGLSLSRIKKYTHVKAHFDTSDQMLTMKSSEELGLGWKYGERLVIERKIPQLL